VANTSHFFGLTHQYTRVRCCWHYK